jgi:branched-chain amino acid transport system substrate-binding protein
MTARKSLALLVAVPVLLAATGCAARPGETAAADDAAGSDEPIVIGVPGAFSGPSGSLGDAIKQGVELKVDEINAAGGLLGGRKIELVFRDHEANPDKGVTNMRELIEREQVVALVGETSSGVAAAEAPVVNAAGVPWVITVSTGTKVTQQAAPNSIARVSLVDKDQTAFAFEAANEKYKKIALMSDTSGYGQGGHTDLLAAMTAAGTKPVADETYKVGDTDMTPQVSRIKAAGADAIINWGLGAEAAQIKRAMKQVGLDIPVIGSWGLSMPNYPELAGPLANDTLVVQAFSFDGGGGKGDEVRKAYEAKYGSGPIQFPNGVANSYDGMGLLAAAIEKAGSTDRKAIAEALNDVEYDGLIKDYDGPFSATDREALGAEDMFLTRIQDGAFLRVEA